MYVNTIADATRMMVSSLTTYSSCEIAAAASPVPSKAVPVLVMRFGEEGNLLITSDARSAGGGGFDELAMERLSSTVYSPISSILLRQLTHG